MYTVSEVSRISGVSVRALHHYDAIGLLKPTRVTEAGYRLYDEAALGRLQTILLFRELRFSLKEIKAILDSPDFDRELALHQQIELLELQHKRLGELISLARDMIETGGNHMDFSAFDKTEIEQYAAQAKARWGKTDAYRAYEEKTAGQTDDERQQNAETLMNIFAEMGRIRHTSPDSDEAQALVKKLQNCISENFYPCTEEILAGLGQMYTQDERFRANIDARGGDGTAAFAAEAIRQYCKE